MERKLPSPAIVERLYWWHGWSDSQIGRRYHVARRCVLAYRHRHGIPSRLPSTRFRPGAECDRCGRPVCEVKRWIPSKHAYEFRKTHWCKYHYLMKWRTWRRNYQRRIRALKGPARGWRGPSGKPAHSTWIR